MKKKISGITKASVAALLAAGVIFPATTSAAPGDIWKLNTDGTKTNLGNGGQIFLQSGLADLLDIQTNPTNYFYEGPKELYTFSDADSVFNANPNLSTEEIQEKLEQELAGKGEEIPAQTLDIQSVVAINNTILKTGNSASYKLALDYLDKEGNVIPAAQLPADLTVSYADSADVFNTDGTIKNSSKIPAVGEKITVVATIKSTTANLNLTKEFQVGVVEATDWASVTDAKIMNNTTELSVVPVGATDLTLVPTGVKQSDGSAVTPEPANWGISQVESVKSSANTVLIATLSGNTINLKPIMAGTATVTVKLKSGFEFTKEIIVKDEGASVVTSATVDQDKLTLSSVEKTGDVIVTVLDQYGNPMSGKTVSAKAGASTIVNTVAGGNTDASGKVTLTVTAADTATTGSDIVNIYVDGDETKSLASFTVDYVKAGETVSYDLRIKSTENKSDDAVLDVYNEKDNTLNLQFVGKDASGNIAKVYNASELSSYTVSSSNDKVATAAISSDVISVTAKGAGTATITVKQGNIIRATFEVTVENSTPTANTIAVKPGASLAVGVSTVLSDDILNSLLSVSGEKDFTIKINQGTKKIEVLDGTTSIGEIKLTSANSGITVTPNTLTVAAPSDVTGTPLLVAQLLQNEKVVNSVEIPVTIDKTPPTAKATATEVGKTAAKKELTTNTGLVFTAKEAGVDGNNISITIVDNTTPTNASDVDTNGKLTVQVSGKDITVELGNTYDSASKISSTLDDIVNEINNHVEASKLVTASLASPEQAVVVGKTESKATLEGGATELTVTVNFSEAVKGKMADTDLTATSGTYTYKYDGSTDSAITPTVTISDDKKTVTLVYEITDATKKLVTSTSKLSIANGKVTDLAGNDLGSDTELTLD